MDQPSFFSQPVWSISEITRYLKDLLENDELLQDLWIKAEISNLSRPASGHIYFSLKDGSAALRCVMWRSVVSRIKIQLRDGMAIEVHGSIGIYEVGGQYQLYVDAIRPAGEGDLYQEFLRLKARLEMEGLFDPVHKRPIPAFPHRIGIVTSPTGAALQDMLKTIRRRFAPVEVYLAPTSVQGVEAPAGIVNAIQVLNKLIHPDIILLARGGGSIEDLWAFNDEQVAHAIYESEAPIIAGIGHETDFTIADFVSDLRAPTPTGAAELATPNREQLLIDLSQRNTRLEHAARLLLENRKGNLSVAYRSLQMRSPIKIIQTDRQRVDELIRLSDLAMAHILQVRRIRLQGLEKSLVNLNPSAVLNRGYAFVLNEAGEPVTTITKIRFDDRINVQLKDGQFPAIVSGTPMEK